MKPIPPFEMFNNKLKAQNNVQFHNEQPFVANHDQHFLMLVHSKSFSETLLCLMSALLSYILRKIMKSKC